MGGPSRPFEQYRSGNAENLSARQLRFGEWWVRRKAPLRRLLIALLLFIGVGGIGVGLWSIGYYFVFGRDALQREEQHLLRVQVPFTKYHESLTPQEPEFDSVSVLAGNGNRYDFVTTAMNTNEEWYLTFDYTFQFDERETAPENVMLVPGMKTVVATLGYASDTRPAAATIQIKNVRWQRISAHLARDIPSYIQERTAVAIRNVQYVPGAQDASDPASLSAHRMMFTAQNNTSFNFWQVPVYLLLRQGSSLRAIERTELGQLRSGETRQVDVRSLKRDLNVDAVDAYPYLPIFDEKLYMPQ